jgi:replicative DNA helicase
LDEAAATMSEPVSYDRHAETSTLAACLISRPARDEARRHLTGGDFFEPMFEVIWEAMGRLDRQGEGVDPARLLSLLQNSHPNAAKMLPDLVTWPAVAEHVAGYAEDVRKWATKRRLHTEAIRTAQMALNPDSDATNLAATVANRFAAIRDSGSPQDAESITLGELLTEVDEEPDWIVPGLLERRDRLILTGVEGLGKSYLLRQIAVMGAAGMDPFDPGVRIKPLSVLIIDCENSMRQVRRKVRPVVDFARKYGTGNADQVNLLCSHRIDITADRDLARIHRELDACQPDLVAIGPLYRLVPRALQTDDEAAPVLAALDTIRDRGISLLIEAHAGHSIGKGGERDLRPRGSSALLGWPEFGYGMRKIADVYADLVAWRGDRDERNWPDRLRHCNQHIRWVPVDPTPIPEEAWA